MEDGISRWLHHHRKVCCEKDGRHGRWALIVDKRYTAEMCFPDEWTWHMIASSFSITLNNINVSIQLHK